MPTTAADKHSLRENSATAWPLVLLLCEIAKGEPTAHLARELGISWKQLPTLRQRIQPNRDATAPTGMMADTAFEADELYQNAGKKSTPHLDSTNPPCRRVNTRSGHGTYANDRPPIIRVISRETGEQCFWVCDHAETRTCQSRLITENVAPGSMQLYTDVWQSYRGSHPFHASPPRCA